MIERRKNIPGRREADKGVCAYHHLLHSTSDELSARVHDHEIEQQRFITKKEFADLRREIFAKLDCKVEWKVIVLLIGIVLTAFGAGWTLLHSEASKNKELLIEISAQIGKVK